MTQAKWKTKKKSSRSDFYHPDCIEKFLGKVENNKKRYYQLKSCAIKIGLMVHDWNKLFKRNNKSCEQKIQIKF